MKSKITKSLSAVAASSFMVGSASAALVSYDGGTGNWDKTTANWNSGTATFADGDDVTFGGAGGTVTATEALSANSIIYSSAANTSIISLDNEADRNAGSTRPGLGSISGPASLLVNGTGTLAFNDQAGSSRVQMANTFTGGTTINSGTLRLNLAHNNNPLGTGDITLNGGNLFLWRVNMANNLIINGGSVTSSNGFGNAWAGGIALNADLDINMGFNMNANGVISGAGGVTLTGGSRTLFLNAANTYTGATTVNSGILGINGTSLDDSSALVIDGGVVNADGTETVGSLSLGGVIQAPGTYGSTSSTATFQDDTFFAGTGVVEVSIPEPSSSALLALSGLALIMRRRK